jgi:hypothetical protein
MQKTLITIAVILVIGTSVGVQAQDTTRFPRKLKIGTYRTHGTMFRGAYREIARQGNRVCIKIVNGIPDPYRGYQIIKVSSVSFHDGKLLVDETNREISIGEGDSFIDNDDVEGTQWELVNSDIEPSKIMDKCLATTDVYGHTNIREFLDGTLQLPDSSSPDSPSYGIPGREGVIVAKEPETKIIVYTGAGTIFDSPYYGLAGDKVIVLGETTGKDGDTWYQVKFLYSDTFGWIRGDFIRVRAYD